MLLIDKIIKKESHNFEGLKLNKISTAISIVNK
jgi:hypothetical protein